MISAIVPLERITGVLMDADYELPATIYLDRSEIQIAFGRNAEIVSFAFVLTGGDLKMVTRRFVANRMTAEVLTVASGLTPVPADSGSRAAANVTPTAEGDSLPAAAAEHHR